MSTSSLSSSTYTQMIPDSSPIDSNHLFSSGAWFRIALSTSPKSSIMDSAATIRATPAMMMGIGPDANSRLFPVISAIMKFPRYSSPNPRITVCSILLAFDPSSNRIIFRE